MRVLQPFWNDVNLFLKVDNSGPQNLSQGLKFHLEEITKGYKPTDAGGWLNTTAIYVHSTLQVRGAVPET